MKSIYDYINNNVQSNGKLKSNFSLNKYRGGVISFDDGTEDGILCFYIEKESDESLVKFIIKQLKNVNEQNIEKIAKNIDTHFEKYEESLINSVDDIINWVLENYEYIDFNSCMNLALYLMTNSQNINSVKLGISLIGETDISNQNWIKEILIKLALCNEFTLYCVMSMKDLKDINNIMFMLVKKVEGWGKIHLINKIDMSDNVIKEWMIINGCANNIKLSYTALTLAQKIDLSKVLDRRDLSLEEYRGISNIIRGLCEKELAQEALEKILFIEVVQKYIKKFQKFKDYIEFYEILIEIIVEFYKIVENYGVTQEKIDIIENITEIIESDASVELYRKLITDNESFKHVLNVLSFDSNINLYGEVYEMFKENPFEYSFCVQYLLENDIFKNRTIKELENSMNYEDYYSKPQSIIGKNSEYCKNLLYILQALEEYPFLSNKLIIAGIKCKYMWTRYSALKTIRCWKKLTGKPIRKFPKEIYEALLELQKTEVIKEYKEQLNDMLDISEDLSKYEDPRVIENEEEINIGLFDKKIDELFEPRIRERGKDYYNKDMVYSCSETSNKYVAFVQGTEFGKEYEVNIKKCLNGNIKEITCTCPFQGYCKHEYATILYLRNKDTNK